MATSKKQKTVVVNTRLVGLLATLYAVKRGDDIKLYELRGGKSNFIPNFYIFNYLL